MSICNTVVVGASSGGIEALRIVLSELPPGLPAAVLVVIHIPEAPSALPETLAKGSGLPARFAADGDALAPGEVLVAPPGHHLLVYGEVLRVVRGPRENGFIPAIDPTFRSAARSGGSRVLGVVLSGALDDGAAGIREIHDRGGVTAAQDPNEAGVGNLPAAAIETGAVDHVLPAREIGRLIVRWARRTRSAERAHEGESDNESAQRDETELGATDLTCPDCGGTLRDAEQSTPPKLACHVGHTFTQETLLASQNEALDRALWAAIRALRESAMLRRKMSQRAREGGLDALADSFDAQAEQSDARADAIREVVTLGG